MKRYRLRSSYGLFYHGYIRRPMLTLEEVQRRLDLHYNKKLSIVRYRGTSRKAVLHCKECGDFETKYSIGNYLNKQYHREDCEICQRKARIKRYNSLLKYSDFTVLDFYTNWDLEHTRTMLILKCKTCGDIVESRASRAYEYARCERCFKEIATIKYKKLLKEHNCEYISREPSGTRTSIKFSCNTCGNVDSVSDSYLIKGYSPCEICKSNYIKANLEDNLKGYNVELISYHHNELSRLIINLKCKLCGETFLYDYSNLKANVGGLCENCNPNSSKNRSIRSFKEAQIIANKSGRVLDNYIDSSSSTVRHLFCGNSSIVEKRNLSKTACKECTRRLCRGSIKEHNKHLVKDYLVILKNVKKLKDILEEHNQLDNFPEGEVKIILEHIDGWISNYKEIMKQYPNGDLGTVLENNPLYERCKEIFYPVMDKFGIERIE